MKNDYRPTPSPDLGEKILARIAARERNILRVKIACFGAAFAGSAALVLFGLSSFGAELARSGSSQFFALFFSDFSSAMANLPDLVFSIAESFPVFSAAFVFGGIAFAVWSGAEIVDEVGQMNRKKLSFK